MQRLIDPIRPYFWALKIGAVVAVAGVIAYQWHRIRDLKDDVRTNAASLDRVIEANHTHWNTVQRLQKELASLVSQRKLEAAAAQAAVQSAQKNADRANARLAATQKELDDVYKRSKTAQVWGSTGVDADVASRLPGGRRTH